MVPVCYRISSRVSYRISRRIYLDFVNRCITVNQAGYIRQFSSKMPKIYTKGGDKGVSSLFTGERKAKDDAIFEALGTVDELSSTIGLACEFAAEHNHKFILQLEKVQCLLQDIGSVIAAPSKKIEFSSEHALDLEKWIDEYTAELPELRNFILPGGGKTSASLHLARTKCRSAERRVVSVSHNFDIDKRVLQYLNRLSDYLFTVARYAAHTEEKEDKIYKKR